ncbi:MAG: alkaline phosphatase family protein [Planctomycetaceae bacterium]
MTRSPELAIFLLDALDPGLTAKWAADGYLPTLQGLMQSGCWSTLGGRDQVAEVGSTLSLFSGISRGRHGLFHYRQLLPGTVEMRPKSAIGVDAPPIWSSFGQRRPVTVLDIAHVLPVPDLAGVQLSNWNAGQADQCRLPPSGVPTSLPEEVRDAIGPSTRFDPFSDDCSPEEDLHVMQKAIDSIKRTGHLCRYLLSKESSDFVAFGFHEAHAAGHRLLRYMKTGGPGRETVMSTALRQVYEALDAEIGSLIRSHFRESNVFVVSAFGVDEMYPVQGLVDDFLSKLGYRTILAPTSLSRWRSPFAAARLLPPRWRTALSNRVPLAVQERLLSDNLRRTTDWSRTKIFALPTNYYAFLRVNLRGREPDGIVEPGREYEALLEQVEADLRALVDPVTNESAVDQVTRSRGVLCDGPPDELPDLFVDWKPAVHERPALIHPRARIEQKRQRYNRDSFHTNVGFMAAAGPAIEGRGAVEQLDLLDLAPTWLNLLGERIPSDLTGRPVDFLSGNSRTTPPD